jgi:hypothetical protein
VKKDFLGAGGSGVRTVAHLSKSRPALHSEEGQLDLPALAVEETSIVMITDSASRIKLNGLRHHTTKYGDVPPRTKDTS